MLDRCLAGFCSNTREGGFSLFRLPKNPELLRKWTVQIRRTREKWTPKERSLLCSAHFTEDCFENGPAIKLSLGHDVRYKKVLLPNAIPTVFVRPRPGVQNKSVSGGSCVNTLSLVNKAPRQSTAVEKRNRLKVGLKLHLCFKNACTYYVIRNCCCELL